jgi:hypothetical protein
MQWLTGCDALHHLLRLQRWFPFWACDPSGGGGAGAAAAVKRGGGPPKSVMRNDANAARAAAARSPEQYLFH